MDIILGEQALSVRDVSKVARGECGVRLSPIARARLERSRELLERWASEDRAIYGMTRGLGHKVTQAIPREARSRFSEMLLRARATGAGGYFGNDVVRASMFVRSAGLALAGAGVRDIVVDTQLAMLEKGVYPRVPKVGSVGAADLVLCANLALPIIGDGFVDYKGEIVRSADAMAAAGINTVQLKEKEGLALCSSNAVSVALGALVVDELQTLLVATEATAALSLEAFRANLSPIDERAACARPAPGQVRSADAMRRFLKGSELFNEGTARRLQDPVSYRCIAQVHGAVRVELDRARENVEIELNSASDNPLILPESDVIIPTGNFHTPSMAIAFDSLRLAITQMGTMIAARVARSLDAAITGLTVGLAPMSDATHTGYGLIKLVAQTLSRELRYLASPVSIDDVGLIAVEDQVPMTPVAVRRTHEQLDFLRQLIACEMLVAAQAIELRNPATIADVPRRVHVAIRGVVQPLGEDRSTTVDIERLSESLRAGELRRAVEDLFPQWSQ